MKLSDKEVKSIITALDNQFQEDEQNYKSTKKQIQKLCNHTRLREVMMGKQCEICGKFIYDKRELRRYQLIQK